MNLTLETIINSLNWNNVTGGKNKNRIEKVTYCINTLLLNNDLESIKKIET